MTLVNLGTINDNTTRENLNQTVTTAEPNDIFKFTTTSNRSINLLLTGLGGDADLKLYRDNGNGTLQMSGRDRDQLISTSEIGGSSDEHINRWRGAGTYFAVVEQFSNASSIAYNLYVSATTQSSNPAGPPNTLARENRLGTLSGSRTFTGSVGSKPDSGTDGFSLNETGDTSDMYEFTLPAGHSVNMVLNGLNANADIRLIRDVDGNRRVGSGDVVISGTNNTGTTPDSLFLNTAGTYYLQVYPVSTTPDAINYNLNFNYT